MIITHIYYINISILIYVIYNKELHFFPPVADFNIFADANFLSAILFSDTARKCLNKGTSLGSILDCGFANFKSN